MLKFKINKETVENNSFVKVLMRFAKSNFVAGILAGIMIWVIALIPIWIYIISRILIVPVGFWQELALFSIFAVLLGWVQVIFLIFGAVCTIVVILDDY